MKPKNEKRKMSFRALNPRFHIDTPAESRNNTFKKCFLSPSMSTSWESGALE
jgi:hypothetical protein